MTWSCGSTASTCPRVRLELPRRRRDPHRRGLLRPALPREGHHGDAGRGPRARAGPLPGQLDPPPPARRHGRRRVLRGRFRRPLPAADRRGHQDRALLRNRLRPRAARGRGGQPVDRIRAGPLRRLLGGAPLEVRGDARRPAAGPARATPPAPPRDRRDAVRSAFVAWSFGHYLEIAPPEFAAAGPRGQGPPRAGEQLAA